jgi:hypothetical protein
MEKGPLYYYYLILQYSPFIPIPVAALNYNKLTPPMRTFVLYLSVSLLLTIIMTVLVLQGKNTLWLMNLGLPIYAGIILWTYSMWQEQPLVQLLIRISIIIFVVVWCIEISVFHRLYGFTVFAKPLLNLLFLIVACLTIFRANMNTETPIVDQPRFWISSGIVLYFGGVMMINLFSNPLLHLSEQTLRNILYIQPALNLAAHILYLKGYLQECQPQKSFGL